MSIEFFKELNGMIVYSTLEASDEEILSELGKEGEFTQSDIDAVRSFINRKVYEKRQQRLAQMKEQFSEHKKKQKNSLSEKLANKSIDEIFSDVIAAIQNPNVPDGISLAFREQSQKGSDESIKEIWRSLMELGLIDNKDDENK